MSIGSTITRDRDLKIQRGTMSAARAAVMTPGAAATGIAAAHGTAVIPGIPAARIGILIGNSLQIARNTEGQVPCVNTDEHRGTGTVC